MSASSADAPPFIFIDRKHQGHDGKGWSQSKDEGAYEPDLPADAAARPVEWTGEYVIQRLIEAFKTDRRLHFQKPRETGGSHPQITYSDDDKAGWLEMPKEDNQIRAKDTREKLDQMEEAFGWLTKMYQVNVNGCFALKNYARIKAQKCSLQRFCKNVGLDRKTFRDRAEKAASDIALALATCRTPVS